MPFSHGQNSAITTALKVAKRSAFGYGGVPGMIDMGPNFTSSLDEPQNHGTREGLADGGLPMGAPQGGMPTLKGSIRSTVAGRTDHLPVHVESGSYVLPADIVSAMGEGNTEAGLKIAEQVFAEPPVGLASGGAPSSPAVPVIVAGGEYVITPSAVAQVGNGDVDAGHKILDSFVKKFRALTVQTLSKLPGPQKD